MAKIRRYKENELPAPGSVFSMPLADGRFGVVRVIRTKVASDYAFAFVVVLIPFGVEAKLRDAAVAVELRQEVVEAATEGHPGGVGLPCSAHVMKVCCFTVGGCSFSNRCRSTFMAISHLVAI